MGCSGKYSISITILLVSIVVESSGELIVVRHPLTDEDDTVKLTCITEEVDAALIWNYDNTTGINVITINSSTSSHLDGQNSPSTTGCEIGTLDSGLCFVGWKNSRGWPEVNSMLYPMAPVHDYRWEGFKESTIVGQASSKWRPMNDNTLVFSARESKYVTVQICKQDTVSQGSCIMIVIGSRSDGRSRIQSCRIGVSNGLPTQQFDCQDIHNEKPHGNKGLEMYEWHTYRIQLGVEKNTVKVFEDVDEAPFLQGTVETGSNDNYHYAVKGDLGTRIRYHDYGYRMTRLSNAVVSMATFQTRKKSLCFKLTFGFCSHCSIKIDLFDETNNATIDNKTISGKNGLTTNGLLAWQSRVVRLSIKTPQPDNTLSLKIQTILNDTKKDEGHWAIDRVSSCQPRGTIRASTITVRKPETDWNKYRPLIVCQKLSHRGSDTIDLSENSGRELNTSHLEEMLKDWRESCGSSFEGFGKGSLICNSNECSCDRGYQGENCTEDDSLQESITEIPSANIREYPSYTECTLGSYGYNCVKPSQNLSWLVVFPILGIILLLLYIWYRKRTKAPAMSRQPSYLEIIPLSPTVSGRNSPPALVGQIDFPLDDLYSIPNDPDSWRVPVENFEEYVKNAVTSAHLNSQFKLLPKGSTKSSEYGRLLGNIRKNRSSNLIAYDDTRVILRKLPGDPYSDYINANYIRGFGKERAYIATQGPMSNTVADFWRMVWQENVRIVCMLTNVIEDGEDKCVQYWPDIGAKVRYGDIVILNAEHQVFADFTFRSFKLRYQQKSRKVAHLHYTGWPSYGIPTYPQSLTLYLKKLLKLPTGDGPVVVHCNTGDDRTGTIILCDICLREVVQTKAIDVTGVTTRMRESRANMVGTLQQFLLAHIMITEVLMVLPTQVPCDDILPKRMRQLRNRLPYDIERLNETMWQQQTLKSLAEPMPLGIEDDADDDLPGEGTLEAVYANLNPTFENQISQIGAVSVDGVKMKRQHIASHLPPPFKLSDFWRFVADNDVKLIIILQCSDPGDPSCSDIMPDESIVHRMPDIEFVVETNSQNDAEDEYFKSEKLKLVETSQENAEPQSVTVLTCRGWARGSNGKPPEPVALVSLWTASERVLRKEGQTLVLCHDGVTACGLYLAMSFLLERMAVERECDVISAIRAVRRSRPEFVQSVEQCEYLYDAAEKYAEYFEHYANFT